MKNKKGFNVIRFVSHMKVSHRLKYFTCLNSCSKEIYVVWYPTVLINSYIQSYGHMYHKMYNINLSNYCYITEPTFNCIYKEKIKIKFEKKISLENETLMTLNLLSAKYFVLHYTFLDIFQYV